MTTLSFSLDELKMSPNRFMFLGNVISLRQVRAFLLLALLGSVLFPSSHLMGNQFLPGLFIFKGFVLAAFIINAVVKFGSIAATAFAIFLIGRVDLRKLRVMAKGLSLFSFLGLSICLLCMQTFKIPSKSATPIEVDRFIDPTEFSVRFHGDSSNNAFLQNIHNLISFEKDYNDSVSVPFSSGDKPENARKFARSLWGIRFVFQDFLYFSLFVFAQWTIFFYLAKSANGTRNSSGEVSEDSSASSR